MGIARAGMISQDGSSIAFNRNLPSAWRKEYRGNAAANIAVMNVSNGSIQEITNTDLQQFKTFANNVFPMWGRRNDLLRVGARRNVQPVRMPPKGGAAQQFDVQGRRCLLPVVSADGKDRSTRSISTRLTS
jgi:Tol biopolymer transport system component